MRPALYLQVAELEAMLQERESELAMACAQVGAGVGRGRAGPDMGEDQLQAVCRCLLDMQGPVCLTMNPLPALLASLPCVGMCTVPCGARLSRPALPLLLAGGGTAGRGSSGALSSALHGCQRRCACFGSRHGACLACGQYVLLGCQALLLLAGACSVCSDPWPPTLQCRALHRPCMPLLSHPHTPCTAPVPAQLRHQLQGERSVAEGTAQEATALLADLAAAQARLARSTAELGLKVGLQH